MDIHLKGNIFSLSIFLLYFNLFTKLGIALYIFIIIKERLWIKLNLHYSNVPFLLWSIFSIYNPKLTSINNCKCYYSDYSMRFLTLNMSTVLHEITSHSSDYVVFVLIHEIVFNPYNQAITQVSYSTSGISMTQTQSFLSTVLENILRYWIIAWKNL